MEWDNLSIPKLKRGISVSWGMDRWKNRFLKTYSFRLSMQFVQILFGLRIVRTCSDLTINVFMLCLCGQNMIHYTTKCHLPRMKLLFTWQHLPQLCQQIWHLGRILSRYSQMTHHFLTKRVKYEVYFVSLSLFRTLEVLTITSYLNP